MPVLRREISYGPTRVGPTFTPKALRVFFTEDIVGAVLVPGPLGFMCGYYVWDSPNRSLAAGLALMVGLASPGLAYVAFAWAGKVRQIKLSLKRSPEQNTPIGPNSIFPWKRIF
jgi:hypothetical protein